MGVGIFKAKGNFLLQIPSLADQSVCWSIYANEQRASHGQARLKNIKKEKQGQDLDPSTLIHIIIQEAEVTMHFLKWNLGIGKSAVVADYMRVCSIAEITLIDL